MGLFPAVVFPWGPLLYELAPGAGPLPADIRDRYREGPERPELRIMGRVARLRGSWHWWIWSHGQFHNGEMGTELGARGHVDWVLRTDGHTLLGLDYSDPESQDKHVREQIALWDRLVRGG